MNIYVQRTTFHVRMLVNERANSSFLHSLAVCASLLGLPIAHLDVTAGEAEPERVATVAPGEHPGGVLIDGGTAHATIVVPAGADAGVTYAAEDIQTVFHQMTGVRLPIAKDNVPLHGNQILVGDTRFTNEIVSSAERADLDEEDYIVRLAGRDLALVGGGPYGTIWTVAELYDRLGARWFMPGELGACVPRLETIRFDKLDVKRAPSFKMRWIGKDTQWNLRNRTNRIDDQDLPPAFVVYPGIYHTQNRLLPNAEYGKTHPEFFALIDGKRSTRPGERKLCNSNPDLPREIARNMGVMLRENPGIELVSLSPTDGQMWCQCDDCRAMDDDTVAPDSPKVRSDQRYSRRQMILYDRVAEELEKEYPDQLILVGAYNTYTWPPRDRTVRGHKNLAVVICHYQPSAACLAHPVNDPACTPNVRYCELIRAWQEHTPHVYFYEYYWKVNWLDLPWPIAHTVAADIPYYKSIGVEGVYTQYTTGSIWSNFIPMYVAARLLWDHTTDVPALLDELYTKFYGKAAEPMRRWHETLESQMATCKAHIPGGAASGAPLVFTERVTDELKRSLAEAQRLAEDDLVKRRLEKVAIMTDYTDRLSAAFRLAQKSTRQTDEKERLSVLKEAYLIGDALRDDLLARPDYYDGVATGVYFKNNLYMHRVLYRWRKSLVDGGVLDPQQYPDKGGAGRR